MQKVTVAGVSNKITVEKVGEIVATGSSNRVVYGEGLNGKKPKITKSGISVTVDMMSNVQEKTGKEKSNKK